MVTEDIRRGLYFDDLRIWMMMDELQGLCCMDVQPGDTRIRWLGGLDEVGLNRSWVGCDFERYAVWFVQKMDVITMGCFGPIL